MAILPLNLARVSNTLRTDVARRNLSRTQQSLLEVQNQLSTGKRLNSPGDNPTDAAAVMQLRKALEQRVSQSANLDYAVSHLTEVDAATGQLVDVLREAQQIASANAGSIVSADERAAAATVVQQLFQQAVSIANTQFQGQYLFAGDAGGSAPFVSDLGGVRFAGSEIQLANSYDRQSLLPFTADGSTLFGALSSRVRGSADLTPRLSADTRLSDITSANGSAIPRGSFRLGNGTDVATIDVSDADDMGDVIDAVNAAGVGGITAALSADGSRLVLSAGPAEAIAVTDTGDGVANALGIAGSAPAGAELDGQALRPAVTPMTRLADLRGGLGIDLAGLAITNGAKTATIDLSTATTVEDLLNAVNLAGAGALARINADGDGIDILNATQGISMSIAENGGSTASDLGVRSFSGDTLLADLNAGRGVGVVDGADLRISRRDGTSFDVDLSGLTTVQQAIDAINAADGGGGVTASLGASSNGIVLTDSIGGAGTLSAASINFSTAAADLGLDVASAGATLDGRDVAGVEGTGLLADLLRLHDSLLANDQVKLTAAADSLQNDLDRAVRFRGEVGVRMKDFEARQERLADQDLAAKAMLSELEDVDYNEAVTRFTLLQSALQANLQTTAQLLNLSLMDFLG